MKNKTVKILYTDMWASFHTRRVEEYFEWILMSKNWNLELSEKPDVLIYSCFGNEHLKYNCQRIFYTPENVRPRFDRCDYAFSFDYPITERNYRLPNYRRLEEYRQLFNTRNAEQILLEKRKFCNILISNPKAKERIEFFLALSRYKKVDSGGKAFNNIGYYIEKGRENKLRWLEKYKFSIAFENSSYPGYTTEKLMDALISNTIPIYWGNPLVFEDFNPKAFINCHDYKSFDEVIDLILEIDSNDQLYREYLEQPFLSNNIETEFCKEENIIARYDEILSTKKVFVSKKVKMLQKYFYHPISFQRKMDKIIRFFIAYMRQLLKIIGI